ncbi:MAG: hypothetical protein IKD50_10230, partial [Clostridia bacterium]|nr:hypothetical protein [Clostridia bacterium]
CQTEALPSQAWPGRLLRTEEKIKAPVPSEMYKRTAGSPICCGSFHTEGKNLSYYLHFPAIMQKITCFFDFPGI